MKLFNKTIFSIFGMALLATGFVACSSDDNATTENLDESQITTMSVNSKYERETMNFINDFYKGSYVITSTEKIIDDSGEEYEVTKIAKDGIESGQLVKILSENKVVFVDKNERTQKLTAFDLDFSNEGVVIDLKKEDYRTTNGWTFKWFKNFGKKFIGSSDDECSDNTYSLEPGSCYHNCYETYYIAGFRLERYKGATPC